MGATVMRTVVSLAGATIAYSVYAAVQGLRKNIAAARRSGLKYVISRKPSGALATKKLVLLPSLPC